MPKDVEKPRYRVLEDLRWPEGLVAAGTEIEFEGEPGETLEPLNKPAEDARAAAVAKQKARAKAAPAVAEAGVAPGLSLTPEQLKQAIADAVAEALPGVAAAVAQAIAAPTAPAAEEQPLG